MPYARETLTQLRQQAMQDITSSDLPGVDGFLRKAVLRVMAWVQAGFAFLHYDYMDWIARMAVPWTARDEYLAAWGALIGINQKDAVTATGSFGVTGAVPTSPLPQGVILARLDGVQYKSTAAGVVAGDGTCTVPIVALVPGAAGNADAGTTLLLVNPIVGINSEGTASTDIVGGADQEPEDDYNLRVLQQFANPPQGGDLADYIEWAEAVAGVTRAWVTPNGNGPGTVVVWTMLDDAESAHGGFPQGTGGIATNDPRDTAATGDQLTVANAIYPKQPVTALVYSEGPTNSPVNFTVTNLGANNTPAMQAAITAALADMFLRLANVGGSVDPDNAGALWPAIDPNQWYAAIGAIPGLTQFDVTVPAAPITPAAGALFTLGVVTFVP